MTKQSDKILWVQCARGLTISLVVLGHMLFGVDDAVGIDPTVFLYSTTTLAMFRMPLFFFVAGIFAYRSIARPTDVLVNRTIMQLVWVYLLWSLVHWAIKVPFGAMGNNGMPLDAILKIAYRPIDVLWFIYVLILFYLVTWATRKLPAFLMVALAATIASAGIETDPKWITRASHMYVYFLMGYMGSELVLAYGQRVKAWYAVAAVPAFAVVSVGMVALDVWRDHTLWFIAACLGIVAMSCLCITIAETWLGSMLRFLGDRSLPIFVMHTIVGPTTRVILTKTGLVTEPLLLVPICTVVAIAVPVAAAVIADRLGLSWVFIKPAWFQIPFSGSSGARPADTSAPLPGSGMPASPGLGRAGR
ncbi:acyltransferase family protein [Arenibaculum pallidiluteum]|uniref:acyltransferase family protein n=1 Tax=Arenibaculum pallidiluteum TaxID=2812559 RepID=UPI001A96D797|nr:acyltransferase family protein [Arenibaculum pallidiluteum]